MNDNVAGLRVKIFADGAAVSELKDLASTPFVRGFTTNPTLMRKAGIDDYTMFVKELTAHITDKPISFEVIADEFEVMERQALVLREFGDNVYVKIPITNRSGVSATPLMGRLAAAGVSVNATAILTIEQVQRAAAVLAGGPPAVISVFAGRIADTGVDPMPIMLAAKAALADHPNLELLWASTREVLNVLQADQCGCDIITITPDLFPKLSLLGRDLDDLSLATVRMFHDDAATAGYDF